MNQRLRLALIVAVFFALPALLTLTLIRSDQQHDALRGDQPGGTIDGRVLGPDGQGLAGVNVLLLCDTDEGTPAVDAPAAETRSGPGGRFELVAPRIVGRYTVLAGGGTWQHVAAVFSFIGGDGKRELTLTVQPGCELEVHFLHADGSAPGPGSYDFEGRPRASWLSIFGLPPLRRQGRVENGVLLLDGLPPMSARLYARFDSGEGIEVRFDLEPGRTERKVRL